MSVTDEILKLDPSLSRYNEGFWNMPYDPNKLGSFSSFNDAGIECETGEFLYSMVRMLKPDHVLETGTHWGIGASYMGMGLRDNGKGKLTTIEFLQEIYLNAQERFARLNLLDSYIMPLLMDVKFYEPSVKFQLILLDTEPQTRFAELVKFYPHLDEGGFVFIHDLHRHMHQIPNVEHGFAWPYGPIPQEMKDLVTSGKLRPFHFSTPRGFTGFYKTSGKDFVWQR